MPESITTEEFELIRKYIKDNTGICLDDTKVNMVSTRLKPLLRTYNCNSYLDLYHKAAYQNDASKDICSALSTNETSFFRDSQVFEMIKDDFIPYFLNKSSSLRIWSAACSYGQEPYSLAMLLHESIPNISKYDIRIEATDISNPAIAYASYGLYNKHEVNRGLDEARLYEHFKLEERGFRIKDRLRYLVHFKELNILDDLSFDQKFDIILCRNIAIYFDIETKKKLFKTISKHLNHNGRLILGSTESLWQITDIFKRVNQGALSYYVHNTDDTHD